MNAVAQFADAREQARKFHPETIGKGVDPARCFGDFLFSVGKDDAKRLEKVYGTTKAVMSESVGGTVGGYLVPVELLPVLLESVAERAIMRQLAFVQPMNSLTLQLPVIDAETVQASGTTPFYGGLNMHWTQENASETETEPTFRQLELRAWDLVGYAVASNPLMQDAVGLEAHLFRCFAGAIAWFEDLAFLRGDGLGKPLGVSVGAGIKTVSRQTGGTLTILDVAGMAAALMPGSWQRSVWVMHPTVLVKLFQFAQWQINNVTAYDGPVGALLTRPVYVSEKLPALGTQGDVILIDPEMYVIGDRMQVSIDANPYQNFLKNQATWRIIERVDGQPAFGKTITLANASTVVSPYVVLV